MKANFYTESVLYWLAKGVSFAAQRLPARWNTACGAGMGRMVYHLLPKRRAVALANLRAAFGSAYRPAEYRRILKSQFQHLGMMLMEIARIPAIDRAYLDRWIQIAPGTRQRWEAVLAEGNGCIFITGHFGNWELIGMTAALEGHPALVLAREQGWPRLNRLLNQYRESKGGRVVSKGFPIRELIWGLAQKRIVGILADQDGGQHGVLAPFFGRLASTAPGAVALSINSHAPLMPVFMVRGQGPKHTLILEEPIAIPETGSLEDRIQAGVSTYLKVLERAIRQHPEQWLWLHRRWKSSPQRRILLFNDGKAGHLTQSKTLAQRIKEAWQIRCRRDQRLRGTDQELMHIQVEQVAYRNPFCRFLLSAAAAVAPKHFQGGDFWLRLALTPASYKAIRSAHADFSISCGSATAPINLLWAWGIGARVIQINQSRVPSWRRFHLAVLPRHDRPPRETPNLLMIDGALAPAQMADSFQLQRWREKFQLDGRPVIGLFVGGSAKQVTVEDRQVQEALQSIVHAAIGLNAALLVTSSRRTPIAVETLLQRELKDHPLCRLLVLVNQNHTGGLSSTQEAVGCILGLSDLLVVSGDSISMVSEALKQSKPVISFLPKTRGWRWGERKHHHFLKQLSEQGRIRLVEPQRIGEAVMETVHGEGSPHPPGGTDPVVEYLVKWL